jgi:hypothetical protein
MFEVLLKSKQVGMFKEIARVPINIFPKKVSIEILILKREQKNT